MIRILSLCALTVALQFSLAIPPAAAQEKLPELEKAKVHYQAGSTFYDKAMYVAALEQFQLAYAAAPTPALLYNMALCQEKLGELALAIKLLRKFEISLPFNKQREDVAAKIKAWEGRLARATPAHSPTPKVEPKPAPKLAPTPEPAAVPEPKRAPEPVPESVPSPDPSPRAGGRLWTWVAAGAAGALGVTALGLGISTSLRHADLEESCGQTQQGCAEEDIDGVGARALATDVFIGLTAGAAVAAVVLFFVERSGGESPAASAWITPRSGGAAVGLGGSF